MNSSDLFGNPKDSAPRVHTQDTYAAPAFVLPLEESGEELETEQPAPRPFIGLSVFIFVIVAALAFQCFRLQVLQNKQNQSLAEGNTLRLITLPADRGLVVDSTGTTLAQNSRQEALAINPQTLPATKAERTTVYALLKQKAGINDKTIQFVEQNRLLSPEIFPIKTNLTKDESLLYKEWFATTPGVVIQEIPIRSYANLTSLGQIMGYVGESNEQDVKNGFALNQQLGKTGVEEIYNMDLSGTSGKQKAVVDASGEVVSSSAPEQTPKAGDTLKLSLDSTIQTIVAASLKNAVDLRAKTFGSKTNSLGASVVILNPNNGAIISMVSLPDYDANLFAGGISQKDYAALTGNPADPLLNRTIQGEFPSGSVAKPLIAAGALQNGVITANTTLDTSSPISIGGSTFPDWKQHGMSNVQQAIAQSNDIFFYAVGGGLASQNIKGLGIDRLNLVLDQFGLGKKTGVDLPGELAGLNPGPTWKQANVGEQWYIGDTYHQSIGQGYLLVTPLQMAAATAAIANGGTLYQPQLGWSLTDAATGKETLLPHKVLNSNWISPANIKTVQDGMAMSTQPGGTAQVLGHFGVTTAGKTGTAEFGSDGLTHSWYIGYAPVDHPQYAYAILIEGDGNVTEATESSEPVAEEILRGIFNKPLAPGQQLDSQALLPVAKP